MIGQWIFKEVDRILEKKSDVSVFNMLLEYQLKNIEKLHNSSQEMNFVTECYSVSGYVGYGCKNYMQPQLFCYVQSHLLCSSSNGFIVMT